MPELKAAGRSKTAVGATTLKAIALEVRGFGCTGCYVGVDGGGQSIGAHCWATL